MKHVSRLIFFMVIGLSQFARSEPVTDGDGHVSLPGARMVPRLKVEVFSDQVKNATALCLDDQGHVYVAETYRWRKGIEDNRDHTYWIMDDLACETVDDRSRLYAKWKDKFQDEQYFTRFSDRVVRLEDTNDDGRADRHLEFAAGFDEDVAGPAIGLLQGPSGIYLTSIPHLWLLKDNDRDGIADERQSLQDGFGVKNSLSGHDLHGLVWGPDGKLYFSMGDRGFNCKTREGRELRDSNSGAVFRCNLDGSELEIFYHRLRNPQELAFNEYGDLFTVDNNCDQGDSARICYLLEGGDTGWHLGAQALTTYRPFIEDGQMDQVPHWLGEGLWKLRFPKQPAHILPPVAHLTNGPSGLTFNSGTSLPNRYQNHFLVCDYKGAPNLCFLYSFKVQQQQAGYRVTDDHLVHAGIPNTDVAVGYDGKIYLSDFGGGWVRSDQGNIYVLYDPETIKRPIVAETRRLFREGFPQRTPDELERLLSHRDIRVRQRAQFALVEKGDDGRTRLIRVATSHENRFARLHAIWGLGQLNAVAPLTDLLNDEAAEIRAQAVRALGDIQDDSVASVIRRLIADPHPRVRTFASIAAGKLRDTQALAAVLEMLRKNSNQDAFERHAGLFALQRIATSPRLADLSRHQSDAVRLAAVLALRRNHDPGVASFLKDANSQIVAETIRAINDETIPDALPVLANAAERLSQDSVAKTDELIFRRLINACLRVGRPRDAATLLHLGEDTSLSELHRRLALKTLLHFDAPPPIDPTVGLYRPLPARDTQRIRDVVAGPIVQLFEKSTGDLAAAAIRVMNHYDVRLDDESLVNRIRDGRQPEEVRRIALQQLAAERRFDHKVLLKSLLVDESPLIRSAAARSYVQTFPNEALGAIHDLIEQGVDMDLRTAYELAAQSESDEMATVITQALDKLMRGELFRTVHLDAYEAARQSSHAAVRAKLVELDQYLAKNSLTSYEFTREGGDPRQGQQIFQNQGICMKCHQGDRGGGDAGPALSDIGRLRRSDELLQSILEPNAVVVDGYGTITVYLDDGSSLNGTVLEDTPKALVLQTASGEIHRIEPNRIEDRTAVTSPMPKPTETLNHADIRDLLAYLQQLKGKAK